ncbi:TolC family protein [Thalassomonas actiniarum]|uniref:TolC family protein n=1 Tax=Thalassomonas actiniarum TaxID=485447 RepID=A0AAF0C6P8_9GAMM|nr:TolC family protein [Thalassomonas actiniarum]WDE02536.1 TolC family protein [Thalassomonas actiniarum]
MKKHLLPGQKTGVIALASMLAFSSAAAIPDSVTAGKGLTLEQSLRIAIANSSSLVTASVQVDLARADELSAADPFDTNFTTSMAFERVRGYEYPEELQQVSAATGGEVTASTFMTDHQNNEQLKSGINKVFRNGIYTELSIELDSSDSDKTAADIADVIPALEATGLRSGARVGDYSPVHPSTIQLTVNVPLMKFSGENNIAAANEKNFRYQREAAEMDLNQQVAAIIQEVFTSYWAYEAALTKLKFTRESKALVDLWLANVSASEQASAAGAGKHISYLNGYKTELSVDISKAKEAANVARSKLAQVLGVSSSDARKITKLADDFPLDWNTTLAYFDNAKIAKRWHALAEANRFDLKAAKLQLDAAKAIYAGSKNDEQSKLDLSFVLKQEGLGLGGDEYVDFSSFNDGRSDLGYTVQLSFEKKLGNYKARAQVDKTRHLRRQKDAEYNNARRSIEIAVDSAITSLYNSLVALKAAKQQSQHYQTALNGIVSNNIFSLADVYDLVSVEQARLQSFTDHVTAIQNVADAIGNARFQTGTMIKKIGDIHQVEVNDLTRLP